MKTQTSLIKTLLFLVVCLFLFTECASDENSQVEYNLSCSAVSCPNADDVSAFQSGNNQAYTCIWDCADYLGSEGIYVSLSFWSWDGECWALEDTFTASGICDSDYTVY